MFLSIMKTFFLSVVLTSALQANIQLIKKENKDSNSTLLVIAGIHGNEPGAYFAASILATHYTIVSKNLWIVPNLNEASIMRNRRGIHGDMNRKFAFLKKNDKDRNIVKEVKRLITLPNVNLVLNLHDGHGFYRKKSEGSIYNPRAWGQTCVIDQCTLKEEQEFGNLDNIATTVKDNVNKKLLKKHHSFNVKNTRTKYFDKAMQLSLTYYAIRENKPAFAIETSKNLSSLTEKVFYQLLAIEEFMKIMHIDFVRDFKFNEKNITKILQKYGTLRINDNIFINLNNIKKHLSYIPLKSKGNNFKFSHVLGNFRKIHGKYVLYIGNKVITTLKPQYFKLSSSCPNTFDAIVDGNLISLPKASDFSAKTDFKILPQEGIRVNIIGYHSKHSKNENNITVRLKDLNSRFSIDKGKRTYRIEFYKKDKFCSMSTINFK